MITLFLVVKFIHIILAIIGVGFSMTSGIIVATASRRQVVPYALQTDTWLEKIYAPAFGGLLLTGLLMAWLGNLQWTALWFIGSLALAAAMIVVATTVLQPTMKRLTELAQKPEPSSEQMMPLLARSRTVRMLMSATATVMTGLMVFKPTL